MKKLKQLVQLILPSQVIITNIQSSHLENFKNKRKIAIDQEIINNSSKTINVFPYRLIKRVNIPDTINFFILHEGLISLFNNELLEKDYDDLIDDCSSNAKILAEFCNNKSIGGWLGFTDKYWLTALIPNQSDDININYRHSKKSGHDSFRAGYAGNVIEINSNNSAIYQGRLFAGAKVVKILKKYQKKNWLCVFIDAVDWGWFSFLTKPIFNAINWFYHKVGNFGLAI